MNEKGILQDFRGNEIYVSVLLRGAADVYSSIANRKFEVGAARAGARPHGAFRDAGFLARGEAFVGIDDLAGAQNLGIDVAAESRQQIYVDRTGSKAKICATTTP